MELIVRIYGILVPIRAVRRLLVSSHRRIGPEKPIIFIMTLGQDVDQSLCQLKTIIHLYIAREWEVLSQWMTLEPVVCEYPP